ncbi:ThiF family adenylyltransferase [Falsihalocynthiibacter sp. SS001]|uniref:ThiF family adenylyltransferase n=1 Tax=Falsihalocynthiibacter sp. SS001 TaxID=3349698 RepID=UPI0036D208BE
MSRYARQIVLSEVGEVGQSRISGARVLVVGAGGLGGPVLQYLVGAGVGKITILDPDTVEESNLHRQVIFGESDIGRPKVSAAADVMANLNASSDISAIQARLDPSNVERHVKNSDLVLDCADSFAASYTLSDACFAADTPLISASALGLTGYVGGFCGGAPSLRAVFPDLPSRTATCATAGILGPVVGMIGSVQAQMALGVLLEFSPRPLGQFVQLDTKTWRPSSFRFDTAQEPQHALRFISKEDITPTDFVVDVRSSEEAPTTVVPHAQRLSVDAFGKSGLRPSENQRAVFCCKSGLRAWRAAQILSENWSGEIVLLAHNPE